MYPKGKRCWRIQRGKRCWRIQRGKRCWRIQLVRGVDVSNGIRGVDVSNGKRCWRILRGKRCWRIHQGKRCWPLSQTGSTPARTYLSPFARCTLGLNQHFYQNIYYAITACMTHGFTSRKYWLKEKWYTVKNWLFAIFNNNSVTTGARELNGTSLI